MSIDIYIEGDMENSRNYANANFARLWELVGPSPLESGQVAVWLLDAMIQNCMRALNAGVDMTKPSSMSRGAKGALCIECGDTDERMRERIREVMVMAVEARKRKKMIFFS